MEASRIGWWQWRGPLQAIRTWTPDKWKEQNDQAKLQPFILECDHDDQDEVESDKFTHS